MFFKDSKDLSLVSFGRGRLNQQEQSPSNSVCRLEPYSVQPLLLAQAVGSTLLPPGKIPSPTSPKRHLPPAAEPEAVTTALIAGPEGTFPWLTGSMHELCAGNHRKGASEQGQAPPAGWARPPCGTQPWGSWTAHHLSRQLCRPAGRAASRPSLAAGRRKP